MNESASLAAESPAETKPEKKEGSFLWFLVKLAVVVLVFRTFIFTSFMIPSGSMMPRLLEGDYLFAAKWPYGYSRASLPFDLDIGAGRLFGGLPERGDVVIFKHPIDRVDYIKRVIGLPGDQVQMIDGMLHLNGEPVPKEQTSDFRRPIRPDETCWNTDAIRRRPDGSFVCLYPQFRETLPNGVSYRVTDIGPAPYYARYKLDPDNTQPVIVPDGMLFVMGDNRDQSMDSRFPAEPGRGVHFVPVENIAGRASFMFFSTDGTAEGLKPWTWFTAARWDRIGHGI